MRREVPDGVSGPDGRRSRGTRVPARLGYGHEHDADEDEHNGPHDACEETVHPSPVGKEQWIHFQSVTRPRPSGACPQVPAQRGAHPQAPVCFACDAAMGRGDPAAVSSPGSGDVARR